jgi:hypothetical protein
MHAARRAYAKEVLRKAWALSRPRFTLSDPVGIGLVSLIGVYYIRGWPETLAGATGYLWAAVPVVVWWLVVLVFNVIRAPYHLHAAQRAESAALRSEVARLTARQTERIEVRIQPQDLIKQLSPLHSFQADAIMKDYVGKWMRVSGEVRNVDEDKRDKTMTVLLRLSGDPGSPRIQLIFDAPTWRDRIVVYQKGVQMSAVGKIRSFSGLSMDLTDCELRPESQDSSSTTPPDAQT